MALLSASLMVAPLGPMLSPALCPHAQALPLGLRLSLAWLDLGSPGACCVIPSPDNMHPPSHDNR